MGRNIAEKILSDHIINGEIFPGNFIEVKVDFVFSNDVTGPLAIKEFNKIGIDKVFDPMRIAFIADHFTPAKDIRSAENVKLIKEFAKKHQTWWWEQGQVGIEHILLPEEGLVLPGDIVIGADSHTCTYGALGVFATGMGSTDIAYAMATGKIWMRVPETIKFIYYGHLKKWVSGKDLILYTISKIGVDGALYKVMEFSGPVARELTLSDRFTMSNMAIEAGGKAGIFEPDEKTVKWVEGRAKRSYKIYVSDSDAKYHNIIEINVNDIELQVAAPHLPSNSKPVWEFTNVKIDQVVIGSCTNGRIEDLRVTAQILAGRKVHPEVRLLVFPGSPAVLKQALKEGIIQTIIEAGGVVSPPTCGPCLGGHMGVLASGEVAVSTTNRNFKGRMGHPDSLVYLTSPPVAAASAVLGRIAHPDELK